MVICGRLPVSGAALLRDDSDWVCVEEDLAIEESGGALRGVSAAFMSQRSCFIYRPRTRIGE